MDMFKSTKQKIGIAGLLFAALFSYLYFFASAMCIQIIDVPLRTPGVPYHVPPPHANPFWCGLHIPPWAFAFITVSSSLIISYVISCLLVSIVIGSKSRR